jgi:periplasmic divalent cation tolerance protein
MEKDCCLVLCTCPDAETARSIAAALVERECAACVNILPGVTSVYRWQGQVEQADEWLLLIKTTRDRYADLEHEIRARHPYEVPEIIAVPIDQGLPDYLRWIADNT